jgi:hypothetical protein
MNSLLKKYVCVTLSLVLNLFQYCFSIHTLAILGMRKKHYKKEQIGKKNMGSVTLDPLLDKIFVTTSCKVYFLGLTPFSLHLN